MLEHRAIRRRAAQHDLFNRLHSIAADEEFVRRVGSSWYNNRFEIVRKYSDPKPNYAKCAGLIGLANQRCGNWYCDPAVGYVQHIKGLCSYKLEQFQCLRLF